MPLYRRTLPSFTLGLSSKQDSFALPDYYRSTRIEHYGPYYRTPEPVRDLMKTMDLRGRDSFDSTFFLPDIFEEDEMELDKMEFEVDAKLEHVGSDAESVPHQTDEERSTPKRVKRLWRLFLSVLRKWRSRLGDAVRYTASGISPRPCQITGL